jgi:hypothetical protein
MYSSMNSSTVADTEGTLASVGCRGQRRGEGSLWGKETRFRRDLRDDGRRGLARLGPRLASCPLSLRSRPGLPRQRASLRLEHRCPRRQRSDRMLAADRREQAGVSGWPSTLERPRSHRRSRRGRRRPYTPGCFDRLREPSALRRRRKDRPPRPELPAGLESPYKYDSQRERADSADPDSRRFLATRSAGALLYEPFSSSSSSGRRRKGA